MHNAFERVYIPCVGGNHGRIDKKPRSKNRAFDNYDWLVYLLLTKHFRGEKDITFDISEGSDVQFALHNTRYLLTHWDQFKGGSGIAGALSPLLLGDARKRKRQMAVQRPYDFMMMDTGTSTSRRGGLSATGQVRDTTNTPHSAISISKCPRRPRGSRIRTWGITARWPIF